MPPKSTTPHQAYAIIYSFSSGPPPSGGGPPPIHQIDVLDSGLGDNNYSPLWEVHAVLGNYTEIKEVNGGELKSEADTDILAAIDAELATIFEPGVVFLCTVVTINAITAGPQVRE